MDIRMLFQQLQSQCRGIEFRENEPLSAHTSFRIGGPAARMAFPKTPEELVQIVSGARALGIPTRVLGAGTNVLAPDEGLAELIVCTKDCLLGLCETAGGQIEAMAGESLAHTAVFARERALTGFEFAHGIPGTVGGGIFMNAGAYGGELKDICRSVRALMPDGSVREFAGDGLFGYRTSVFQTNGAIILSAVFALSKGDEAAIREKMRELMQRRMASQPLELPSAGSTFKRPEGAFAGALIQEAKLKGVCIGGARVSEKHAGFVVNTGGATARDVRALIALVQKRVLETSGYCLQPEVRIW